MNRRIFVLLSVISVNLMACCCGGVTPQAQKPNPPNVNVIAKKPGQGPGQSVAHIPIETRKQIYLAYNNALNVSLKDPREIEINKQSEKLARSNIGKNDAKTRDKFYAGMRRLSDESEKIANAYVKKMAADQHGVTMDQVWEIIFEGQDNLWPNE